MKLSSLVTEILDINIDRPLEPELKRGLPVRKQDISLKPEKYREINFISLRTLLLWLRKPEVMERLVEFGNKKTQQDITTTLQGKVPKRIRSLKGTAGAKGKAENRTLQQAFKFIAQETGININTIIIYNKVGADYFGFFFPVVSKNDTTEVIFKATDYDIFAVDFTSLKYGMVTANSGDPLGILEKIVLSVNFTHRKWPSKRFYVFHGMPTDMDKGKDMFSSRRHRIYNKMLKKFLPKPTIKKAITYPIDDSGIKFHTVFASVDFDADRIIEFVSKAGHNKNILMQILIYIAKETKTTFTADDLKKIGLETSRINMVKTGKANREIQRALQINLVTNKYREVLFKKYEEKINRIARQIVITFDRAIKGNVDESEEQYINKMLGLIRGEAISRFSFILISAIIKKKIYKDKRLGVDTELEDLYDKYSTPVDLAIDAVMDDFKELVVNLEDDEDSEIKVNVKSVEDEISSYVPSLYERTLNIIMKDPYLDEFEKELNDDVTKEFSNIRKYFDV